MATTTNVKPGLSKSAQRGGSRFPLLAIPASVLNRESLMTYLTAAAALGAAGGAGIGAAVSHIKSKNPKIVALDRKKEFYDKKVDEMANDNWLNEVMATRKKLESSKLSDEERTALEDKYIKLLDASK